MNASDERDDGLRGPGGGGRGPIRRGPVAPPPGPVPVGGLAVLGLICLVVGAIVVGYNSCKIEVGTGEEVVLIRRIGLDLERDMELAPPRKDGKTYYKGVQTEGPHGGVLLEG